jgi:hypothetical protein
VVAVGEHAADVLGGYGICFRESKQQVSFKSQRGTRHCLFGTGFR